MLVRIVQVMFLPYSEMLVRQLFHPRIPLWTIKVAFTNVLCQFDGLKAWCSE